MKGWKKGRNKGFWPEYLQLQFISSNDSNSKLFPNHRATTFYKYSLYYHPDHLLSSKASNASGVQLRGRDTTEDAN